MQGDLHRQVSRITLDLHRKIENRRAITRVYGNYEREQQFQFPFNGMVGYLPVEITVKVLFDICFAQDAGVARDSQLGEPIFRHGFRLVSAPAGSVPYAHVPSWVQDDDLNFIGANITVGIHNPGFLANTQYESVPFGGMFHCTFQGFGYPIDVEGEGPDGGIPFS